MSEHAQADHPIEGFVAPHLGRDDLRRVTLSGGPPARRKAVLRPVEVRGERRLQVVVYDERRSTTTNVDHADDPLVHELLRATFRNVVVELAGEVLEGRVTKKGRLVSSRGRRTGDDAAKPPDLRHDREKDRLVPQDAPFLQTLGLATAEGRVKPTAQAKYRQIDEFVRLLDASLPTDRTSLRVVDVGCGNAYVTFAAYHHLTANRGLAATVIGVDRNAELVERNRERAAALGWDGLRFEVGDIASFAPEEAPDVVIALHACDTASDHALASYVRWGSDLALVAPCCHHHLHAQLRAQDVGAADSLLLRHGVLRQQLGDTLTDTARATILRLLGHDVDVVEFVAPEFTPKNTMLRARRRELPVSDDLRAAYDDLVSRYRVRPFLADLVPLPESRTTDRREEAAMTTTTPSAPDLRGDAPHS